jgi:hypothetical protein
MSAHAPAQFYFEVYCPPSGLFRAGWQRRPGVFASFLDAQKAAIRNNVRPYRIKREVAPLAVEQREAL